MRKVFFALLGAVSLVSLVAADLPIGSVTLRELSSFGGATPSGACEESGGYLYYPTLSGLLVVDARDHKDIRFVEHFPLMSPNPGVALKIGRFLVVGIHRTLQVFDISRPEKPVLLQTATLPQTTFPIYEMHLYDGKILIREVSRGGDIQRPATYIATLNESGELSVDLLGNGPYWADNNLLCGGIRHDLYVWDWKTRAQIATFQPRVPTGVPNYAYFPVSNVFIKGNFIFLTCGFMRITLELVGNILIERDTVFPVSQHSRHFLRQNKLWLAGEETSVGVKTSVVDLQNPASPVLERTLPFEVLHVGDNLGVAEGKEMYLFDPNTDPFTTLTRFQRSFEIWFPKFKGKDLIASGPELFSFSLENPEKPTLLSSKRFEQPLGGVSIQDEKIFVTRSIRIGGSVGTSLAVYEDAFGTNTEPSASVFFSSTLASLGLDADRIYLKVPGTSMDNRKLFFFDHDLQLLGNYEIPQHFSNFDHPAARNHIFYLRCRLNSFGERWLVVDLSDLANPKILKEYTPIRESDGWAIIDKNLFVVSDTGHIDVFDTDGPEYLRAVSSIKVNGSLYTVLTDNPDFLAVWGSGKTFFFDYSDISNPRMIGSISETSFPDGRGVYRKPFLYWCSRNALKTFVVLPENELTYSSHSSRLNFFLPVEQRLQSRRQFVDEVWNDLPPAAVHSIPLDDNGQFFRAVREQQLISDLNGIN